MKNQRFTMIQNDMLRHFSDLQISAEEFLVYCLLKSYTSSKKFEKTSYPSYATIGKTLGWSVDAKGRSRAAERAILGLEAKGLITVERRKGSNGLNISNLYVLDLEHVLLQLQETSDPKLRRRELIDYLESCRSKPEYRIWHAKKAKQVLQCSPEATKDSSSTFATNNELRAMFGQPSDDLQTSSDG